MSAFPISPGGKPITNEEARAAVETALFEMGLTRPMTLAEKEAFCETAKSSLNYQSNSYRVKENAYRRRKFCGICSRQMAGCAVNNARAIFGVILAAAALASVATLHHVLSSRPLSPPQAIEAPSLALRESVAQEFADLPRSIHTVPIVRPAAPTAAASEPERPTQTPPPRVATQPDIPTTSPSHAQPVDVCARYGGHRVDFMRGHHGMWRCIYPRHR